ncbi:NADPH-dependent FMN reductase [Alkalihalobacillus sp. BA299]|uniref:NADPH-dependent FMN reductase n=1 Tax=Alkalihalobacillus sp. BA299 TaxID=2815938 RepID=UPI001ADBFA64|nr:NADPH-dependent FMN reductase [Alkalihalobacillus sp. BA299]
MKIAVISGTLVGSKPAVLANQAVVNLQQKNIEVVYINFKDYELEFCDGRPINQYNQDTQELIRLLNDVQGFIITTSILHGQIPGVLKNFFEVLPISIFENKVMSFMASAGNERHYLAIEHSFRPLSSYLNAISIPEYVYSVSSDFNKSNEIINKDIVSEIESLVDKVIHIARLYERLII